VELRLPVGVTNSPVVASGDSKLELTSLAHQTGRASETGELRVKEARFEYRQTVEEVLAEHRGEKINRLAAGFPHGSASHEGLPALDNLGIGCMRNLASSRHAP